MGQRWRVCALATALVSTVGCGDDSSGQAWEPTAGLATGVATSAGTDPGPTDEGSAGESCTPGMTEACLCPDGLSLGERECTDGAMWSSCLCESADDDDGSSESGTTMPPLPDEVCYLGADETNTTCVPLVAFYDELPEGYDYPAPTQGDGSDRPPLALIDLQESPGSLAIAPNFVLDELAALSDGRWAVVQPHAVQALQNMRDQAGPIAVMTGYLSPSANAASGGAPDARFMYGDGFDLDPIDISMEALADLCVGEGGDAAVFDTHVHCDLSATPLDEAFFGPP